jgi:hypothetical protein
MRCQAITMSNGGHLCSLSSINWYPLNSGSKAQSGLKYGLCIVFRVSYAWLAIAAVTGDIRVSNLCTTFLDWKKKVHFRYTCIVIDASCRLIG